MKLLPTLAAACILLASQAHAEAVIKLGYTLPPESVMGAGARAFTAELNKALPGKYRVDDQPASKLGGDADVLKGLQLGTVEMTIVGGGGAISTVVPEASVTDLPFLFRDSAHARAVLDGPVGADILAAFPKYGLVGLAWGEQGMRQITNSKKAIRTLEDLKGIKLRTPQSPIYVATFKALGADVNPMPWPEVYPALQNGRAEISDHFEPHLLVGPARDVRRVLGRGAGRRQARLHRRGQGRRQGDARLCRQGERGSGGLPALQGHGGGGDHRPRLLHQGRAAGL